jgi:REP element-mobilizing transposase RayT
MEIRKTALEPGKFYHIFNRGINKSQVFFEEKNYPFFLEKYAQYVFPWVKTYAYCLLGNHYHLLVQVREETEMTIPGKSNRRAEWHVSNAFSSFLQSYTRAINKVYDRSGALFETPFKRIEVTNDSYYSRLVSYIHQNPQKHGIVEDFKDYPHSSYWSHLTSSKNSKLERTDVLDWFGGENAYQDFHVYDFSIIEKELSLEDIS